MDNKEIVLFETKDREVRLDVAVDGENVWLNRQQMADLFGRDVKTIGKHINNALKEELNDSTVAKFASVQIEGDRQVERNINHLFKDTHVELLYDDGEKIILDDVGIGKTGKR